ncbi:MAG: DUF1175 domain-containing protein [bacterium]|nr:DUF1175 domain-containing protein [bacterium]
MFRLICTLQADNVKHILRTLIGAWLCVSASVTGACDFRLGSSGDTSIELETRSFAANGVAGGVLRFATNFPAETALVVLGPLGDAQAVEILKREQNASGQSSIHFRSAGPPGRAVFFTNHGAVVVLNFAGAGRMDSDGDGFPDAVELTAAADRSAFRAWFLRIADSQYLRTSHAWNRGERDCSGLIRFAYREALKKHDARWQRRSGVVLDKNLPDVRRYHYPAVPVLGERIFRVATGRSPIEANFADFASAEFLARLNARRIGRDPGAALPGDLLFFWNPDDSEMPFHSMIVAENDPRNGAVILYHTGGEAGIKRVPIAYLLESEDVRWRPTVGNDRFLGVYRFHILD